MICNGFRYLAYQAHPPQHNPQVLIHHHMSQLLIVVIVIDRRRHRHWLLSSHRCHIHCPRRRYIHWSSSSSLSSHHHRRRRWFHHIHHTYIIVSSSSSSYAKAAKAIPPPFVKAAMALLLLLSCGMPPWLYSLLTKPSCHSNFELSRILTLILNWTLKFWANWQLPCSSIIIIVIICWLIIKSIKFEQQHQ